MPPCNARPIMNNLITIPMFSDVLLAAVIEFAVKIMLLVPFTIIIIMAHYNQ